MTEKKNDKKKLRSREWFDNPHDPGMTALYLERYLNFGPHAGRTARRQADHRHRPVGQRPVALQPPSSRSGDPHPRRYPRCRRHPDGIPHPSDPGNR
jgi:hypothetical protein